MPQAINKRLVNLIISGLLFTTPAALAQQAENNQANWYQVEVFIFANESYNSAQGEQWPDQLRLRYPDNSVRLAMASQPQLDTPSITPEPATTAELQAVDAHAEPEPDAIQPAAFELLPSDHLTLTQQAEKLTSKNDFRGLFHGAWRQTMADRDNSVAVVIRGGNPFDEHFELEGTIRLSVERYLHIQTDLWLSRFINATASEEPNWETLPKVPAPAAVLVESESANVTTFFSNESTPFTMNHQLDRFDFINQRQYRVEKTVAMRQDRRMRSEELHYIDHPLLGVLVKVTPYEAPLEPEQTSESITDTAAQQ